MQRKTFWGVLLIYRLHVFRASHRTTSHFIQTTNIYIIFVYFKIVHKIKSSKGTGNPESSEEQDDKEQLQSI